MKNLPIDEIHIVANASLYGGMSGGDRIYTELAKIWAANGIDVHLYGWEEAAKMWEQANVKGARIHYHLWPLGPLSGLPFFLNFFVRTWIGNRFASMVRINREKRALIYSASDFLPDSCPAYQMKRANPNAIWWAGFYLFAPNPFYGFNEQKKQLRFPTPKTIAYYALQRRAYRLVHKHADLVGVTSDPDIKRFVTPARDETKIIVVQGGVDTKTPLRVPEQPKKYDAIFIGRFHPQKGVLELMDIWARVLKRDPNRKLAIIGRGPLEKEMRQLTREHKMENAIDFLGFMDNEEKFKVFKSSRIVLHPATYDSGGMAACEAFACGLPGVAFDLEALKTYYPKGMVKVPQGDHDAYVDEIYRLWDDAAHYKRTSKDALDLARTVWEWDVRFQNVNTLLTTALHSLPR